MRAFAVALLIAAFARGGESAQPALQSLAVDPPKATIEEGATAVFLAIGTYANGVRKNVTDNVTWSSGDRGIVTVTGDGTVKAVGHGTVTIQATMGKIAARAQLTVQPRLTSVRVDPSLITLVPGESYTFTVRGRYSDGRGALLADRARWSIEGDGAATMDAGGRATAVRIGAATVVATVGGLRATARLLVGADVPRPALVPPSIPVPEPQPEPQPARPPFLQKVVVEPEAHSLSENEAKRLTAWGRYSDGSVRDITGEAVWSSTDVRVAHVGYDGTVIAVRYGTTTIAATLDTYSGVAAMTVTPVISRIVIRPADLSLRHRATKHMEVVAVLTDDSIHDITDQVAWTSSNEGVAAVRDGSIEALAPGTATITAAFDDFTASVPVAVEPVVESIAIQPQVATLTIGQIQQLTATATFSDGTTKDVTLTARWTNDSPAVRVSPTGLVTGMGQGSAVVKVQIGDVEAEATIAVSAPAP